MLSTETVNPPPEVEVEKTDEVIEETPIKTEATEATETTNENVKLTHKKAYL